MSPNPLVPPALMAGKNLLASSEEWLWLYEIEVPTSPPTTYRLVRSTALVVFRGHRYYPFPIGHGVSQEGSSGNLPSTSLTVSNVTREVMGVLETHGGLVGQTARIICTTRSVAEAGIDGAMSEARYKIMSTTATESTVSMSLSDTPLYDTQVPGQRMMKAYCRHQYRSAGCGYVVPEVNGNFVATCDKTLSGPKGCEMHGASETAAGLTAVHPERFGGFPGIPTPSRGGNV